MTSPAFGLPGGRGGLAVTYRIIESLAVRQRPRRIHEVIVLTSFNPAALRYSLAGTLTLTWPEVLDVARTAERLGFDAFYATDHLMGGDSRYFARQWRDSCPATRGADILSARRMTLS
jgi:hypothetical protein